MEIVDFWLYEEINEVVAGHPWLEDLTESFADYGHILFIAVLVGLFFARGKWTTVNGRRGVAAAGLSVVLALGIAHLIGTLWDRPRPYEAHPDVGLWIARSPDPSFPSDHATAAFALAVAVFCFHRRAGWLMLAMAAVLSISRVAAGTHYPSDVLGGAALGALAALFIVKFPPTRRLTDAAGDLAGTAYDRIAGAARRFPTSGVAKRTPSH